MGIGMAVFVSRIIPQKWKKGLSFMNQCLHCAGEDPPPHVVLLVLSSSPFLP